MSRYTQTTLVASLIGALQCFVTVRLHPFASNYVLPPSYSISILWVFTCYYLSVCVCAVPCSRQVLWVMKDVEVEPRGCGSPLLGCLLHVSPHISPPSILFNPNLSHSTLNKDATTWRFLDQTALRTKTRKRTEVIASCFTAACWSTCPSLPLCILPINCLNSAAKFGACIDIHTSNHLFFRA